jgi:glycosyltransferase involved in cell wall biosynthesis
VFVFPSEVEGLPNAIIEASLAGLPIVACNVPGVRDIIQNGDNGVLVPPRAPERIAEAVEALIQDSERRRDLAARARNAAVSRYSINKTLDQLYALYDNCLAK